jgi:NAD/NADP transhydrogenase beta subunit
LQVGFAAVSTAVGHFMAHAALPLIDKATAYLGVLIGAITLTGSAVAFGKLHGVLDSSPLNLTGKNAINVGLLVACAAAGYVFMTTGATAALVPASCVQLCGPFSVR